MPPELRDAIERQPFSPVLGNPKGDVTLTEFFDYNCPHCRTSVPVIRKLIGDDPHLRVVLREWPVYGEGSEFCARASLASLKQGKYWQFHSGLMAIRGRAEEASATLTLLGGFLGAGKGALIAALRQICDHASGKGAGEIDGILLETSGLADPAAIAAAIAADPVLTRRLIWRETIVLIDAEHGGRLLTGEALARRQIESAHRLIITRAGHAAPRTLAGIAATLARIAPDARISASEMGMPLALPDITAPPLALSALEDGAPITAFRLAVGSDGGWVALSTWLSALLQARGDELVRVKGVVRTPAGRLLIQSVRRIVQPPEILPAENESFARPAPDEDMLVLIGRNIDADRLRRSWAIYGA